MPQCLYIHLVVHFVLALPASFTEKLKNQDKKEGETVTLRCELSKPAADVQWKKGSEILKAGEKYEMKQQDSSLELHIKDLKVEDSGEYSCVCGDQKTSATVKVNGMDSKGAQVLKSGEKYQMKQKASVNELLINKVVPEDSGDYSCVCGDQKTTASLNVKGRS
uniref:Ig-like domain-containing protein n=1 Tax=Lates calcarifer TaxID=8187 RepID=A0A4W6CCV4_LATCA